MKRFAVVLFLAVFGFGANCSHTTTNTIPSSVVDCTSSEVAELGPSLISLVQSARAGSSWLSDLEALAEKHGLKLIACIVDSIVKRSGVDFASSGGHDTLSKVKADRGAEWLASKGVVVQ